MTDRDHAETKTAAEMPRYRCHKEVHALKIGAIRLDALEWKPGEERGDGAVIVPFDNRFAPFRVGSGFVEKHFGSRDPLDYVGGYFVVYEDGYQSFSPARAFETGYTRI